MRMRGDEIIQALDFVTLQRIEHDFALTGIARVDQNGLAAGRDDQNRITFDWSDVEHVDLQLSRRFWRARTPPRQSNLPEPNRAGAEQQHKHRNRTSASACTSLHLKWNSVSENFRSLLYYARQSYENFTRSSTSNPIDTSARAYITG